MNPKAKPIGPRYLRLLRLSGTPARANSAQHAQISGAAKASLEKQSNGLYPQATSRSFQLAQFVANEKTRTALVEGEILHRLQVTDGLAAKEDETGTVKLYDPPD